VHVALCLPHLLLVASWLLLTLAVELKRVSFMNFSMIFFNWFDVEKIFICKAIVGVVRKQLYSKLDKEKILKTQIYG